MKEVLQDFDGRIIFRGYCITKVQYAEDATLPVGAWKTNNIINISEIS